MGYLAAGLSLLVLIVSGAALYFGLRSRDLRESLTSAEFAARHNAEVATEMGEQLKKSLAALRQAMDQDADDDREEASRVTDADSAAKFLRESGGSAGNDAAPAVPPKARRARRATFIAGFGRPLRHPPMDRGARLRHLDPGQPPRATDGPSLSGDC